MPQEPSTGEPTRIGRYEVLTHLATGGMAQIYLARQSGLGSFERHVVLKTILRERAQDQRFVTMFLDEAKLAATLNHQNIAQVYEVDQADGAYFMAMEFVHGENVRALLETALRRGWTIPLELAVMIISGAAAGLHHAHERRGKNGLPLNIVHRDVSPANIMVGYDGSVKVLDFGIAKAEERATKTVGGTIKGKYGYMSPEQCKGKPIDRRSDIFALGIVLYELTTLRRAFKGVDDFETMKRIVSGDVVRPTVAIPGYPRELEAIVLTALANDPNARFQSGQELIEALDTFAVRAKLTGSNTAMGRFMTQLFGAKREPWVEGGNGESTEVGGQASSDGDDNEKTAIVENPRIPDAARRDGAVARPAQAQGAALRAAADAAAWQAQDATQKQRQQARAPAPRGGYGADDDPDGDERASTLTGQPPPGRGTHQGPAAAPLPVSPRLPAPPAQHGPGLDEHSLAGARPLDADPRLGWPSNSGSVPPHQQVTAPGSGARLASAPTSDEDYRIRPSRLWVIIAVALVLAAAGGIAVMILFP